jgi:hypothetical protein
MNTDHDDWRNQTEHDARLARSRLANTLGALDQRRHRALDLGFRLREHTGPLLAAGIGLLVALVGGIAVVAIRAQQRAVRVVGARVRRFAPGARLPAWVAFGQDRSPFWWFRHRLAVTFATLLASRLARRLVRRVTAG